MNLELDTEIGSSYRSGSQRSRVMTESWLHANVPCPQCGDYLVKLQNNSPVADFSCPACSEEFELKSSSGKITKSIPDGAYRTMIERLMSRRNPSLFLLHYDLRQSLVDNLVVIPKQFFSLSTIEKRPPLGPDARRAGWVGCNIVVGNIPKAGRIPIVVDRAIVSFERVMSAWKRTAFLRDIGDQEAKGWLLDTLRCIEQIAKPRFSLSDVYEFEPLLQKLHPNNKHVRPKLRQQLQVLRDHGFVTFLGRGVYEIASHAVTPHHFAR